MTGLRPNSLAADLSTFVEGRLVDDNAHIWLRYPCGAKGQIWTSQVAIGNENNLKLRIYGDLGGLEWHQEEPNNLWYIQKGGVRKNIRRGSNDLGADAKAATRIPAGHPEGYLEAFATIYSDIADCLDGGSSGNIVPNISDGIEGMWFIEACMASSAQNGAWYFRDF